MNLTQCKTLAFTNGTGGNVDDIHVDLTGTTMMFRTIAKVWDDDGVAWTCATTLPANTIDCVRTTGTLAATKEIFLAIQLDNGSVVDTAAARSYWTLDGVSRGALGVVMQRTTVMLRNDTQGPATDLHLVLGASKKVYEVLSMVDSTKVAWTCTVIPAGGLNAIDCTRNAATFAFEYKGILTIDWKIDTGASISSGYWTQNATNVGPITIIRMDP